MFFVCCSLIGGWQSSSSSFSFSWWSFFCCPFGVGRQSSSSPFSFSWLWFVCCSCGVGRQSSSFSFSWWLFRLLFLQRWQAVFIIIAPILLVVVCLLFSRRRHKRSLSAPFSFSRRLFVFCSFGVGRQSPS